MSAAAVRASELTPRAVRWLWWPFVPLGKITAIAGQMGQAKSLWTLWLAAAVTQGRGINLSRPGDVLILSAEDDPEDTTIPRLIAARADLARIHFVGDLELDAASLGERCHELPDVRLIVVDPLNAYLGARVDSWKTQDVRRALEPNRRLAQERSLAFVVVQHLNRRGDTADALARSVLVWGPNPADPEGDHGGMKVLTRAKMNLARGSASAAFQIEEATVGSGIRAPRLTHKGHSDARAEDVVADAETRTRTAEAMRFLREQLADGPQEAEVVKTAATAADISPKCLRTARERVARSYRPGGNQGPYVWVLQTSTNGEGIHGHSGATRDARLPVNAQVAHVIDDEPPEGFVSFVAHHAPDDPGSEAPTLTDEDLEGLRVTWEAEQLEAALP